MKIDDLPKDLAQVKSPLGQRIRNNANASIRCNDNLMGIKIVSEDASKNISKSHIFVNILRDNNKNVLIQGNILKDINNKKYEQLLKEKFQRTSAKNKVTSLLETMSDDQLKLTLDFMENVLLGDANQVEPAQPEKPQWSERTTGREVTPIDWIKMHYGNQNPDNWEPEGLTTAILSREDRRLYETYLTSIRRKPELELDIPKEQRSAIADAEHTLAMKRKANRDYYARQKKSDGNTLKQ